jgi:hypothetical protein
MIGAPIVPNGCRSAADGTYTCAAQAQAPVREFFKIQMNDALKEEQRIQNLQGVAEVRAAQKKAFAESIGSRPPPKSKEEAAKALADMRANMEKVGKEAAKKTDKWL